MKHALTAGVIVLLLISMVGCGGGSDSGSSAQGGTEAASEPAKPAVSVEEAKEAFAVGMISVISASMSAAFGEAMPGVTFDAETQLLTLDGFNLQELAGEDSDIPYTLISGTATPSDEATVVDLTMEGGPVKTIAFELTPEMFQSEAGFTVSLTLNGTPLEVEIVPEDLQGPQ